MKTQYHLNGRGMSKRAVRVEPLGPEELEDNLVATAKLVGVEATALEFKKTEWRNGIKQMIVEFSEPCDNPLDPTVKWKKVTPGLLDDLGEYFKGKDVAVLEAVFRDVHEVLPSELAEITGKAVPVSESAD